jgi:aldehyde:ferredoxin oxidoreductase
MAWRRGIGAVFADGVEKASRILGKETEPFALHSKGLEVSLSCPTPMVSLALGWATSNRGACHLEGFSHQIEGGVPFPEMGYTQAMDGTSGEEKGRMTALMQDYMAVFNALGLCKFLFFARLPQETICKWIEGLTGWDLTGRDLMEAGERIYNLKRAYNVLMGVNAEKDVVAPRILQTLRPGRPIEEGEKLFFDMRRDFYRARGWDDHGIPTREKLLSLGLEEAAEKIDTR